MPRFEVFIPAAEGTAFDVTFRVDAASWMAALKTGLEKLGQQGSEVHHVFVDVQDDESVHVTESASGRVLRIRELSVGVAGAATTEKGPLAIGAPAREPTTERGIGGLAAAAAEPATWVGPPPFEESAPNTLEGRGVREPLFALDAPTVVEMAGPSTPVTGRIGREVTHARRDEIDDMLAEVFERVQEVYTRASEDEALYFLLDLALEKIPAEAGSFFSADGTTGDLSFRAVRGPKADEIREAGIVLPAGTGIAGFCALEGVSLAVSDVEKDPRFDAAVAERVQYPPKSILCAPMLTHGRTFGCLQILNKQGDARFDEVELGLAAYIAHQAALYLSSR